MVSGGAPNPNPNPPTTLSLFPSQTSPPKPPSPPPHSSEMPTNLSLAPPKSSSDHPPKPAVQPKKPKSKAKPKQKQPLPNKKPQALPDLNSSEEQLKLMADKAVHYNWLPWLPKSSPSDAIIPWVPYVLCNMHKELLKGNIEPDDDIYAQLPCTLVHGKRFNMKKEQAYLMFGRRYQKKVYAGRQIAGCRAKWDSKDGWDKVCAQNGDVVGVHYGMFLRHEGVKSEESAVWTADEYISISSEAGDSSVVVLRCKNREWNQVEEHIELAETQLFENYKQLIKAEHEGFTSEVEMLKPDVFNSQALLGFAISEFEAQRAVLREAQDKSAGAKPGVYDDTNFGLRVPCAASVTVGAFFTSLNQRKIEENMKKIQKQDKRNLESSTSTCGDVGAKEINAAAVSSISIDGGSIIEGNASFHERQGPKPSAAAAAAKIVSRDP